MSESCKLESRMQIPESAPSLKDNILYLRSKGKTYKEIIDLLDCTRNTIKYHLIDTFKEAGRKRNNASRIKRRKKLKQEFGGKCQICGYDKCLAALDFHHKDKSVKIERVSKLMSGSYEKAREEASKCSLICSNCHRELHDKEDSACVPQLATGLSS